MKTLKKTAVAFFAAIISLISISSCSDDLSKSMVLSGQWTGDFGMSYVYSYSGRSYTFDSRYTDIVFYPDYDYATEGYGYQVDFYDEGPYVYQSYKFDWEIEDGVLYMDYRYSSMLDCTIHDYHMTNDRFYGYFGNSDVRFSLAKLADYYDWTPYENTYSYGGRTWYRYDSVKSAGDALPVNPEDGQIVKVFNRYNK
ncbi:MAG: hypothetical protein K5984_07715 [Bacteroidales bacterium]|nr:hypothetical protein [Bacteroidales bacterium]